MSLDFPGIAADRAIELGELNVPAATGAMSMTGWVNPTSQDSGDEAQLIAKGSGFSNSSKVWAAQIEDTDAPNAIRGVINTSAGIITVDGTSVFPNGVWTFWAVTYDGANIRVFFNAVQEGIGAQTGDIVTNTKATALAAVIVSSTPERELDGSIDDTRVYDRALSLAELQTMLVLLGKDNIVFGLLHRWTQAEKAPGQTATVTGSIKDFGSGQFNGDPLGTPTYIEGILR